jgi:hypothetical protein
MPAEEPAVEKPAEVKPTDTMPAEEPAATEPAGKSLSSEAPLADEIDDFWSEHPASKEMPTDDLLGDPFLDDPSSDAAPAKEAAPSKSEGTNAAPTTDSVQRASYQPPLNMGEFRARIDGFDRGLRDLETDLLKDEHPGDDQLALLSRTMDELLRQREFLELYFKGLSDAERESLAEPQSPDDVLKLLNTRLAEADKPAFERTEVRVEESM